jgi:hypothetical protein
MPFSVPFQRSIALKCVLENCADCESIETSFPSEEPGFLLPKIATPMTEVVESGNDSRVGAEPEV